MKLFTDRLLSMMCTYRGQKPPENGESFHGIRNPKTGQKLVLISGCAYSESESVYDSLLKEYECILVNHLEWVGYVTHVLTHLVTLGIENETRRD